MKTTRDYVFFWKTAEIYSNWHPSVFTDEAGRRFVNCEQYLMYHKALVMNDAETAAQILGESNPGKIKALGRQVRNFSEALWEEKRLAIMEAGCYLKFTQNPALCTELLATGRRTLVEASPVDSIWGIGMAENDPLVEIPAQWRGRNLLGIALTNVRERIRSEGTK
jgi:ribA/ribD-fused uncharacterized protein